MSYSLLSVLLSFGSGLAAAFVQEPFPNVSHDLWNGLRHQVDGRLLGGEPFSLPCFSQFGSEHRNVNSTACSTVQAGYLNESTRSNAPGAYINTQWETCQATQEQCLLDYLDPQDGSATAGTCHMGSVSNYMIDVRTPEDVVTAFEFSRRTKVPLVIKNTGHDYKGRSSAPHSLALWTHNLKNISYNENFVAEGCSQAKPGVTVGAGVQWGEAYAFAEAHNITVVGGSDQTVGVSGGWLQGGGHGALSNTMGLGVDRVLQYKIVTPDGEYRTVNACQNEDLFFALRGGGGGTFGVVLESTILASPRVTLQVAIVGFQNPNTTLTEALWTILIDNGLKWAEEGWGGYATSELAILVSPVSDKAQAAKSMAPLLEFGQQLQNDRVVGAQAILAEFSSWGGFFETFAAAHVANVGVSLALASRLINKSNFQTSSDRSALLSGLLAAKTATPGLIILISPPSSFPGDGKTSVTDAWRESVYHVTVVSQWNWNATTEEKRANYRLASQSIDHLRRITPDAAYHNEADVYEPNHEVAFWGEHYPELLRIKRKYDPEQLLDCWQCVGWNPKSLRYACYL